MNETEKKSMDLVIEYEKKHSRNPKDVSNKHCGYDIKSKGRFIEVKGQRTKRGNWVILHRSLFKKKGKIDFKKYYLYIVHDINGKPKLKIIPFYKIIQNLEIIPQLKITTKSINEIPDTKDFP